MSAWRDREEFKARVLEWAAKLHVEARSVAVRPMRRKWGSCSTAGNLNFNAELLELDRDLGDYVIVHELMHFAVPNHGKLWKSLMRAHLGDYERVESLLRKRAGGQRHSTARTQFLRASRDCGTDEMNDHPSRVCGTDRIRLIAIETMKGAFGIEGALRFLRFQPVRKTEFKLYW